MINVKRILLAGVIILNGLPVCAQTPPNPEARFANYVAINLGSKINSAQNEFAPLISVDDSTLIFVSDSRPGGVGKEDFWMSTRTGPGDTDWSQPINLRGLNSPDADGAITMTRDGHTYYFASAPKSAVRGDVDIWKANIGLDNKANITRLGSPINSKAWETQPAISPDGKTLFFASNRKGKIGSDSLNNVDIFVSHMQPDSSWSNPVNLGSKINTSKYDATPFIAPDGKTLYFCTDGRGGLGGLDIFQSTWLGPTDTDWSEPIHLPAPINASGNDFFVSAPASGDRIYFASDRPGGYGRFDIWVARKK